MTDEEWGAIPQVKTCSKCGISKPVSDFWKDWSKPDGRCTVCKDCKRDLGTGLLCTVEGCERPARGRGLCGLHYQRLLAHGDPLYEWQRPTKEPATCAVEGCDAPAQHLGLCGKHYTRQHRHGDPLYETLSRRHRDVRGQFEGGGWRSFEQARAYVRTLHHAGPAQYRAWAKSGERPADIPARPDWVYKGQGWSGWGDWLREVPVTRPGSQVRRTAALVPTGVAPAPDRPVHIYGLTEPDQPWTIRYVGQVWQPPGRSAEEALQKRLKEHISLAKAMQGSSNHRVNWIKRVLRQGHVPGIVLLDTGTVATGDDLETFHIRAQRAAGFDLTNIGDGGGTNRGKKIGPAWNKGRTLSTEEKKKVHKIVFTPEVRAKMSAAKKGKKQDPDVVAKRVATTKITAPERGAHVAAANRGKKRTPEQIERIKEGRRAAGGWVHTPESRAKIGEAGKGRTPWNKGQTGVSDETRAKMRASHLGKEPANKGRTHCVHGHEYTPENTIINTKGARVCKTCQQLRYQARKERLRADAVQG
jgi:hypothetical protein